MSHLKEKKAKMAMKLGKHGPGHITYLGKKGKGSLKSTGKDEGEQMYLGKDEHNRA